MPSLLLAPVQRKVFLIFLLCVASTALCSVPPIMLGQSQSGSQTSKSQQSAHKTATLVVDTDDACHFFIDDEDKGQITADASHKFTVSIGDHILKCKNDSIPDLVWRKVVEVKDTSQVAAVVSLKGLHIQYDQAVTKAQNQKAEADAAAGKQLAEAQAEEKQREAEKAAMPARVFGMVRGTWHAHKEKNDGFFNYIDDYTLEFVDGLDSATLTTASTLTAPAQYGLPPSGGNYTYKLAMKLDSVDLKTLTGTATCQTTTQKKAMAKGTNSRGVGQCQDTRESPIDIVISNQTELLMNWGGESIVLRRN